MEDKNRPILIFSQKSSVVSQAQGLSTPRPYKEACKFVSLKNNYNYCNENNGNPTHRRNDNNSAIIIVDASLEKSPFDLLP